MAANVLEITDANWKSEVLESTVPVMVDFWAPWCGPCRMLAPTIEKLAGELEGKVKIGKMNTDENSETPGGLRISAIPTVLIFQAGREVDRLVGVNTETKFKASLQKLPGYIDSPPTLKTPTAPEEQPSDDAIEARKRSQARGQGPRVTKELRLALEKYAMDAATRHFKSQGFVVEDHSKSQPYDLRCRRGHEEVY